EAKTHSFSLTFSISNIEVIGEDIFINIPRTKKQLKTIPKFPTTPIEIIKGIEINEVRRIKRSWVVLFINHGVIKIPTKIKNCRREKARPISLVDKLNFSFR